MHFHDCLMMSERECATVRGGTVNLTGCCTPDKQLTSQVSLYYHLIFFLRYADVNFYFHLNDFF